MLATGGKRFLSNAAIAVAFFALGAVATLLVHQRSSMPEPSTDSTTLAAQPMQAAVSGKHCRVEYQGIDPKWAPAYANICDAVFQGYLETFGYTLPEPLAVSISVTGEETRLWTDGKSAVFLQLRQEDDLLPSSRYKNVYGMCHEPGHIFMYSGLSSIAGLPEGVGEGWAHYCGSVICDYVWKVLGKDAYPVPFDYSGTGSSRLEAQCKGKDKDNTTLAACTFFELGKKYGHKLIGQAMRQALESKPSGAQLMPLFSDALSQLTGAPAKSLLPEQMMAKKLKWDSKLLQEGKSPKAAFFTGLKSNAEGWLYYDDDANEGMRSIAGSGHAVVFRKAGGGKLVAVKMKGSRYGPEESGSVFRLTILDASFKAIRQLEFPFMKYAQRGEALYWVEFPIPSIGVPEVFFVAFDFSPTSTDGVYVGFDESSQGHSFMALPNDHLSDFEKREWMVRSQVK